MSWFIYMKEDKPSTSTITQLDTQEPKSAHHIEVITPLQKRSKKKSTYKVDYRKIAIKSCCIYLSGG